MLRWIILALLVTAAAIGIAVRGMTVTGLMTPLGLMGIVGVAAFHFRREENFTLCLSALVQIAVFSMSFVVLTYLGAETARPLCDKTFAAWDAALGFHLPSMKTWLSLHPWSEKLLQLAYDSLLPQTAAIIALLGFRGERKSLETFILRMMIAALVAYVFFLAMPAEGTFSAFGATPSGWQVHYLEHFRTLRAGHFHQFSFADAEGLITFPSFHTVWAIFLFMAVRQRHVLRVFFAALEVAVIASTVTAGGHYLVDVLAGFVLAVLVCWITAERPEENQSPSSCPESSPSDGARVEMVGEGRQD